MAPREDEWEEDEDEREPPPWVTEAEDDSSTSVSPDIVLSIVSQSVPYAVMGSITPTNSAFGPGFTGDVVPTARPPLPSIRPDWWPSNRPYPPYEIPTSSTESWQTSTSTTTPYADHWGSSSLWTTSTSTSHISNLASLSPTSPYGGRPSNWNFSRKHANNAPMYAAAAIIPIVVLAIIGGVTLICLRKRKQRRKTEEEALSTQNLAQEMKMQPPKPNVVQPYMAPPPSSPPPPPPAISVSPNHLLPPTSTSSAFQPIILGPIGSDSIGGGAYLTGMDTSDMVSVSSNTLRPGVDPFADNNSLTEPPPPYRPSSAAPPSFTTNSRHSSLTEGSLRDGSLRETERELRGREGGLGSRTRLIGRDEGDPFGDPEDGDAVSELSGPTLGMEGEGDGMSVVSDLSYQRFT